jgi:zinc transport system ATP-binding protein
MSEKCLLEVKTLSVFYGNTLALEKICLPIYKGDYLYVLGNNGAGKSTLIKAILGLVPVHSGHIIYHLAKNTMAYLPQEATFLSSMPVSVQEVVLSGLHHPLFRFPFISRQTIKKASVILESLEIAHLKSRLVSDLSGGQKQRVLLARALISQPQLLILDEPTANMDHDASKDLYALLKELNKQGLTIIMISHDQKAATTYAKQIAIISTHLCFMGNKATWLKQKQELLSP